jgi:hypothetical protein
VSSYAVEYDHQPLGQGVEALCWLTVAPHGLEAAGRAAAEWPEVRFAAAVSGRAGLVLSVLCRTTDDLYTVVGGRPALACPPGGALVPLCRAYRVCPVPSL